MIDLRVATFDTPLGRMAVAWTPRGLARVTLPGDAAPKGERSHHPSYIKRFIGDVKRHLDGRRVSLRRYRIDLHGHSPFAWRVYRAARRIPWGRTVTYGKLACLLGRPGAARAVGTCLGRNPVPLVVPCHRVVAASGTGGFSARGGRKLKERLLALECG